MVPVILTLYAGEEDHAYRLAHRSQGVTALRRPQIERMAHEALDQGVLLTAEDLAFRIFSVAYVPSVGTCGHWPCRTSLCHFARSIHYRTLL